MRRGALAAFRRSIAFIACVLLFGVTCVAVHGTTHTDTEKLAALPSSKELLAALNPRLNDRDPAVRAAAVEELDMYRDDASVQGDAVLRALNDSHPEVNIRYLAARVLTWMRADPRATQPVLLRMLRDREDTVQIETLLAMGGVGVYGLDSLSAYRVIDTIEARISSNDQRIRLAAATALADIGPPAVRSMSVALRSAHQGVALTAVRGLRAVPHVAAIDRPLLDALSDDRGAVRDAAALALVGAAARVEQNLQRLASREIHFNALSSLSGVRLLEINCVVAP